MIVCSQIYHIRSTQQKHISLFFVTAYLQSRHFGCMMQGCLLWFAAQERQKDFDFCAQENCVSEKSKSCDLLLMRRRKVTEVLLPLREAMEPCCLCHQLWSCLLGEWRAARLCGIFIWTRSSVQCLIRGSYANIPLTVLGQSCDSNVKQRSFSKFDRVWNWQLSYQNTRTQPYVTQP